jgi:hypothetical protein
MFNLLANITTCLVLTITSVVFLDYFFGTEKFKFIRNYMTNNYISVLVLVWLSIGVLANVCGYIFDNGIFINLGTFYICSSLFSLWVYFTGLYIVKGTINFRQYCLDKRKKPR